MTAEPWYPIPVDQEGDAGWCGCGGLCDCADPSEDVALPEENDPATGERPGSEPKENPFDCEQA